MSEIKLREPLKLVNERSEAYPLGTEFIYDIPSFVFDFDGLEVIVNLKEENVLEYRLAPFFAGYIEEPRFNKAKMLEEVEERLIDFDSYLKVRIKTDDTIAYLLDKANNLTHEDNSASSFKKKSP